MVNNVEFDDRYFTNLMSEMQRLFDNTRLEINTIIDRNKDVSSYQEVTGKRLLEAYGKCADDYSKVCYYMSGISEAIIDLKTVKKLLYVNTSKIVPSMQKLYQSRIDYTINMMEEFKESIKFSKDGLEARIRYFNSCTYISYDRALGAKC